MAEDNIDELVSPVTNVKNDSVAEDNIDERVSPVTSVNNDSVAEDNTDDLVSPVTSVKNDSAGNKPDKISSRKPRSLSNGHRVLPCYRKSSSASSYDGGNTRRQSTGKLDSPDSGQDVLPHYMRASTGSCHDFCKYGRKHSSEAKPWHTLSKRKNKLLADEHSPTQTMVGEAKKGTAVKQKPSTTTGIMVGEKKKMTEAAQKHSTPPGSMLGEAKEGTMVKQNSSTTSGSILGQATKGTLVKQKPSTPPGCMLEEEKKVRQESILGDGKTVAVVEQKLSSPPGSMLGEGDEVTVVNQEPYTPPESVLGEEKKITMVEKMPSASPESMLEEGEMVTLVEQKLSTPPGGLMEEGKKVTVVNQKPSAPPGSMLGQGKKLNVVNRRTSPKVHSLEPSEITLKKAPLLPKSVHSLKLDSSGNKIPKTEKKMKYVLAKHSPLGQIKMVKSSSKILGGVDAGGRKDNDVNSGKQIIVSEVSAEKSLKTPTVSCSPKSCSVKPLILRARNNKSLKLLAPLKDQNKMRRDGTNKLNPEKVPEKTLHVTKVKASLKFSSQSQSRSLSNKEDKKKVVESADSASDKYTSSRKKLLNIAEAETVGKNQKKILRKGKAGVSNDPNPSAVKLKFRRGKVVDLQQETSTPRRLIFRWGRHMGESQDSKGDIRRVLKKKGVDADKNNTILSSGKIVLRHQDVQEKKDVQGLLNNVIEETASKLVETRKSKVKALVGAFETVISRQDKPNTVTVS
ncbi:PREDICTED: uncharacterized protein LOC109206536 [Nicotiana attenuata]|uniref:Calmodulin-binding domain-containing protein n=1 Tax=Nicotiana attenuata TaxID=49451 RepID=A0A314KUY9_NICAT|nr:PREDICTED: uncharacterized protein LOC109206536 [Nicotiana attenuata]XP_019224907.1 PREDICTED: uncharacterized protein LOC109206536 [Nicotiana attenuata]OIT33015.1 hypothetical protein A4A49_19246 [Nicotiana attenuata]